jgi:23S rRNA maturation-related 3'-5' exoribonuclease YhaM
LWTANLRIIGRSDTMQTHFAPSPQIDINQNQETVIFLLQTIQRPGIESLIDYLLTSDYFTAPASTKFHNVCEGGLCFHSLKVMRMFSEENKLWGKPIPQDSVIISGLLHDLCKIGAYRKTSNGYESVKGEKGHAYLSILRIKKYIELTLTEDDLIRFHMGLHGLYVYKEYYALPMYQAILRTPQVQLFAALDQADSKRKMK